MHLYAALFMWGINAQRAGRLCVISPGLCIITRAITASAEPPRYSCNMRCALFPPCGGASCAGTTHSSNTTCTLHLVLNTMPLALEVQVDC